MKKICLLFTILFSTTIFANNIKPLNYLINYSNNNVIITSENILNNIYINIPATIYYFHNDKYGVRLKSNDQQLLNNISYNVNNDNLFIKISPKYLDFTLNNINEKTFVLYIEGPQMPNIVLNQNLNQLRSKLSK